MESFVLDLHRLRQGPTRPTPGELAWQEKLWHLALALPQRRKAPSADPVEKTDSVAESVDRLSAEVRCLREVLDEVREDFSWVTRNGLPIRPMEHVRVCRMPRDPNADDWAARLVIDRIALPEIAQTSQQDSDSLEDLAWNLTATFEAAAKEQIEPVLRASPKGTSPYTT